MRSFAKHLTRLHCRALDLFVESFLMKASQALCKPLQSFLFLQIYDKLKSFVISNFKHFPHCNILLASHSNVPYSFTLFKFLIKNSLSECKFSTTETTIWCNYEAFVIFEQFFCHFTI